MSDKPVVNFMGLGTRAAIGAGLALPVAAIGSAIYNSNQVQNNASKGELNSYRRNADKYNQAFDKYMATKPGFLQNPNDSAEGRRFAQTGQRFIENDEQLRQKYTNPWVSGGIVAGGMGIGAGLGIASKYLMR